MTLDDILHILATSKTEDWYLSKLTEERQVAAYRPDVNLRAEITDDKEGTHRENFSESWTRIFSDKSVEPRNVWVWYGQTFIKAYIILSVDGGRAYLPFPDLDPNTGYTISKDAYFIASLLDANHTLDQYMKMADFSVR